MLKESVCLSPTNALPMLPMVTASLVTRDMMSSRDPVSFQLLTLPSLPISDADCGTGTTKFVFNAQRAMSSTSTKSVLQPLTSARLLTLYLVTALLVMKATTFKMDHVSTLLQTMPDLLTSDVPLGTGKIKSA